MPLGHDFFQNQSFIETFWLPARPFQQEISLSSPRNGHAACAAEGITNIAHTSFLSQLVHEVEALVDLSTVKVVKVGRIHQKKTR